MSKKCERCGYESADSMRFCLECGATLPESTMAFNPQGGGTQNQPNANTSPYNRSVETVVGAQGFPTNFPPPSQPRPRSGGSKIFLILGGIFSLFFLIFLAGAAVVYYNWKPTKRTTFDSTPTPLPTRPIVEKSLTPAPSVMPSVAPPVPPSQNPPSTGNARFDKIWVDYNVNENSQPGMRIHVKFSVFNMKDVTCYLKVGFQKRDGTKIFTNNTSYRDSSGQVAVFRALKPAFAPETEYKDLTAFMPYSELNLSRGKYELTMDVDLVYENQDLIQHLAFNYFKFEQP